MTTTPTLSQATPTITQLSPDGLPWAADASDFRVDRETQKCINFVAPGASTSQSASIITPYPVLDVISGHSNPYRSSYFTSGDDQSDETSSSDGSWDFVDSQSVSTAPTSRNSQDTRERPALPEVAKLEESISAELLPDVLIVNDPQGKTKYITEFETSIRTTRYKRVYPRLDATSPSSVVPSRSEATLDFTDAQSIGAGSHSQVFLARLQLPIPLTARSITGEVHIAAKISLSDTRSHDMLRNEAKMYAKGLPPHLSEDWTGYHFVGEAMYDDGTGVLPVCAVVPKFYGYYIPEHWTYRGLVSPIMLVEECGVPVEREELRAEDRELLYSFVTRLHRAGICQNSFKTSNILQQPGPLSVEPSQRSWAQPSFRVIDFGRGERRGDLSGKDWREIRRDEVKDLKDEIYGRKREMRHPQSKKKYMTRRFLRSSIGLQ